VTCSAASHSGVAVWALNGLASTAPVATASSTASPASLDLTTGQDGVLVTAVAAKGASGPNVAWSGATEDFDSAVEAFPGFFSGASVGLTGSGTRNLTAIYAAGSGFRGVAASFR
jgi:hypothetical protein